ncbi:MAG: hypothetical protein IJT03_04475 [Clostridia bacterium]|nr:hypothetical protein [Clostridia bacterium]
MINRDENGVIVSADSLADINAEIEKINDSLNYAIKNGMDSMSNGEKEELVRQMADLKVLLALNTPELQKSAKPAQLLSFLRLIMKVKGSAEKFKEKYGNDD